MRKRRTMLEHRGAGVQMREQHLEQARRRAELQRGWAERHADGEAATFELEEDAAPVGPGRYQEALQPRAGQPLYEPARDYAVE